MNLRELHKTNQVAEAELWDDDDLDYIKKNRSDHIYLYKIYNEFKDKCQEIHYPAYYIKGKNGPYINNICLVPENLNDDRSDYSYYKGVYIDLRKEKDECDVIIYIDGVAVYHEYNFEEPQPLILEYILKQLTTEEWELIQKFL